MFNKTPTPTSPLLDDGQTKGRTLQDNYIKINYLVMLDIQKKIWRISLSFENSHGKVLVVCPIKNEQLGLREAINSILSQDYKDLIVFVVDNFSSDESLNIANDLASKDPRVVVSCTNSSLSVNRSWEFALSKSLQNFEFDYMMFFAGDDRLINRSFISSSLKKIEIKQKSMGVVPKFIDQFGDTAVAMKLKKNVNRNQYSLCVNWAYVHAVYGLYKRECWEQIHNRYSEVFNKSVKFDWWLAINLLSFPIHYSEKSHYLKHKKSIDYGSDYYLSGENFEIKKQISSDLNQSFSQILRNLYEETTTHFDMQTNFVKDNSRFFRLKIFTLFFFTGIITRLRDRFLRWRMDRKASLT